MWTKGKAVKKSKEIGDIIDGCLTSDELWGFRTCLMIHESLLFRFNSFQIIGFSHLCTVEAHQLNA